MKFIFILKNYNLNLKWINFITVYINLKNHDKKNSLEFWFNFFSGLGALFLLKYNIYAYLNML